MGKSSSRYSVKGNGMIAKFINRNSEVQNEDEVKDELLNRKLLNKNTVDYFGIGACCVLYSLGKKYRWNLPEDIIRENEKIQDPELNYRVSSYRNIREAERSYHIQWMYGCQNDPMDLLQFIKHFGCFKMCQEYASVLDGEAAKYEKSLQIKDPILHIENSEPSTSFSSSKSSMIHIEYATFEASPGKNKSNPKKRFYKDHQKRPRKPESKLDRYIWQLEYKEELIQRKVLKLGGKKDHFGIDAYRVQYSLGKKKRWTLPEDIISENADIQDNEKNYRVSSYQTLREGVNSYQFISWYFGEKDDLKDLQKYVQHFSHFRHVNIPMCHQYASVVDGQVVRCDRKLHTRDPVLHAKNSEPITSSQPPLIHIEYATFETTISRNYFNAKTRYFWDPYKNSWKSELKRDRFYRESEYKKTNEQEYPQHGLFRDMEQLYIDNASDYDCHDEPDSIYFCPSQSDYFGSEDEGSSSEVETSSGE
ncbi:hypothetical protein WR25_22984 [Diploscapter pachys]|uniref:Uncharacterized protein n=1 Tax=Diploscapter pachys TaxID=2018661 RepID=A0A2A2JM33_9BILA|nr:hypothetical protein WR25_22984 [Diploscapter pachys]